MYWARTADAFSAELHRPVKTLTFWVFVLESKLEVVYFFQACYFKIKPPHQRQDEIVVMRTNSASPYQNCKIWIIVVLFLNQERAVGVSNAESASIAWDPSMVSFSQRNGSSESHNRSVMFFIYRTFSSHIILTPGIVPFNYKMLSFQFVCLIPVHGVVRGIFNRNKPQLQTHMETQWNSKGMWLLRLLVYFIDSENEIWDPIVSWWFGYVGGFPVVPRCSESSFECVRVISQRWFLWISGRQISRFHWHNFSGGVVTTCITLIKEAGEASH